MGFSLELHFKLRLWNCMFVEWNGNNKGGSGTLSVGIRAMCICDSLKYGNITLAFQYCMIIILCFLKKKSHLVFSSFLILCLLAGVSNLLNTCSWVGLCCLCEVVIDIKQVGNTLLAFQWEIYSFPPFTGTERSNKWRIVWRMAIALLSFLMTLTNLSTPISSIFQE